MTWQTLEIEGHTGRVISHKCTQISGQIQITQIVLSATRPAAHSPRHWAPSRVPPCIAPVHAGTPAPPYADAALHATPSALSVPNSAAPRLRGLPIRKPVGCNYPSGGGRVAVNTTVSRRPAGGGGVYQGKGRQRKNHRSSLFLGRPFTNTNSRPSVPCHTML